MDGPGPGPEEVEGAERLNHLGSSVTPLQSEGHLQCDWSQSETFGKEKETLKVSVSIQIVSFLILA